MSEGRTTTREAQSRYRTARRLAVVLPAIAAATIAGLAAIVSRQGPPGLGALPQAVPRAPVRADEVRGPDADPRLPVASPVELQVGHRRQERTMPAPRPRELIVLRTVGGASWLSLRLGSASGRLLFEGTLPPGRVIRLGRGPIWVQVGVPRSVAVSLGRRPLRTLPGSASTVLLSANGLRVLARRVSPAAISVAPPPATRTSRPPPATTPPRTRARGGAKPLPSVAARGTGRAKPAAGPRPRRDVPAPLPAPS
jgi:hypothetical protein